MSLDVLGQDGVKVRAAAGAGSFRRRKRLEASGGNSHGASRGSCGRNSTATRRRGERRKRATAREATRARGKSGWRRRASGWRNSRPERARRGKTIKAEVAKQKEPRASTTDAEARVMKMADGGGFNPVYNMEIVSRCRGSRKVLIDVNIDTNGSDQGLAREGATGKALAPAGSANRRDYLVHSAGSPKTTISNGRITACHDRLSCPPTSKLGGDPYAPRHDDPARGMADWRKRMASEPGKLLLSGALERPSARTYKTARRMGLTQLLVRGKRKSSAGNAARGSHGITCCAPSPCAGRPRRETAA